MINSPIQRNDQPLDQVVSFDSDSPWMQKVLDYKTSYISFRYQKVLKIYSAIIVNAPWTHNTDQDYITGL